MAATKNGGEDAVKRFFLREGNHPSDSPSTPHFMSKKFVTMSLEVSRQEMTTGLKTVIESDHPLGGASGFKIPVRD